LTAAADDDFPFKNNVPDPLLSGKELPTFKFAMKKSQGKVIDGSYGKEATVEQLPISKGIAGVSMKLEPGAMRELHWHATAAEWAFVIEGRTRTTVIDPQGNSETNDFEPGDVWYFPRGHGHQLECLGDKPTHFIPIFDNGYFSECRRSLDPHARTPPGPGETWAGKLAHRARRRHSAAGLRRALHGRGSCHLRTGYGHPDRCTQGPGDSGAPLHGRKQPVRWKPGEFFTGNGIKLRGRETCARLRSRSINSHPCLWSTGR